MIGRRCWSQSRPVRAVSRPRTGGGALAGGITKPAMIPAEAGRWGALHWEWSRTAGMGACCRGSLGAGPRLAVRVAGGDLQGGDHLP